MDVLQQTAATAALLLLLAGAMWALRRAGIARPLPAWLARANARPGRDLELLARLPLTPQHQLHLVRCGERRLLVATGPGGAALLAEPSFKALLAEAVERPEDGQ